MLSQKSHDIQRLVSPATWEELLRRQRVTTAPFAAQAGLPNGYLRIYREEFFDAAARYQWAIDHLPHQGLLAPRLLKKKLCDTSRGTRLALCFSDLEGEALDPHSPLAVETLAHELRQWHSWDLNCLPNPGQAHHVGLQDLSKVEVAQLIRRAPPSLQWLGSEIQSTVAAIRCHYEQCRLVVSHGDLNRGNILLLPDNRLGWIDLDSVCLRSPFCDLAEVEVRMFRAYPAAADLFEACYFQNNVAEQKQWQRERLTWYRFAMLKRTILWPIGTTTWYMQLLAWCRATLLQKDGGESSGKLLAAIKATARKCLQSQQAMVKQAA